jgi:hypothetical protein
VWMERTKARRTPASAQGVEWKRYKQGKFFPLYSSETGVGEKTFPPLFDRYYDRPIHVGTGNESGTARATWEDGGRPKTNAQHSLPVGRQRMGNSLKRPNVSRAPTYLQTQHKPTSTQ